MEELLTTLAPYGATVLNEEEVTFDLNSSGNNGNLLVLAGYNIAEMMEEIIDEEGSLQAFVEKAAGEMQQMPKLEAFRAIARSSLTYTDLAPELKQVEDKDFDQVFAAYGQIWEGSELMNEILAATSHSHQPLDTKWVLDRMEEGLIQLPLPANQTHLAPLIIPMGGFNECPLPLYQAVLFKAWRDEYGAVPLLVKEDTWVLRADKLPATDEEALQLAKEHFLFCQYVLETFDTVGEYAAFLKKEPVWHFWWD